MDIQKFFRGVNIPIYMADHGRTPQISEVTMTKGLVLYPPLVREGG